MDSSKRSQTLEEEIDLFSLLGKLYKKRHTILSVTVLLSMLTLLVYDFYPETYQSEAILAEATPIAFSEINQVSSLIDSLNEIDTESNDSRIITPKYVFQLMVRLLTSPETERNLFAHTSLARAASIQPDPEEANYINFKKFKRRYSVDITNDNSYSRIFIRYQSSTAAESAQLITRHLLPYIRKKTISIIEEQQTQLIRIKKNQLNQEILELENTFRSENNLRITELEEALSQAKSAGIRQFNNTRITPIVLEKASYLLGEKLLNERINTLKQRENNYRYSTSTASGSDNKPYIRGVADKLFSLDQLGKLKINYSNLYPLQVEQSAQVPAFSMGPDISIIIIFGVILGFMLGILVALLQIAIQK